jgi:hypothetical protein
MAVSQDLEKQIECYLNFVQADSDVIFTDLDHDGDGQINFEDFSFGFRDFLVPGSRRGSIQLGLLPTLTQVNVKLGLLPTLTQVNAQLGLQPTFTQAIFSYRADA